ncbi:hypothetical protein M885DRAFT_515878 [Pelagophyceae sp. CCMP2097]|nr:hypothetical protein M885DRAFT_515878 [Pelagophyceae sp. CCMP2097]
MTSLFAGTGPFSGPWGLVGPLFVGRLKWVPYSKLPQGRRRSFAAKPRSSDAGVRAPHPRGPRGSKERFQE